MSLASNLAALGRVLTAAAGGIVKAIAPAAGDSSTALITSAWFKGEQAAEATQGTAKVATQAQTNAGTDDATIVTPKKLRAGFAISLGAIGYIAFPTWLGGVIIQWGMTTGSGTSAGAVVTLPIAMPTAICQIVTSDSGSSLFTGGTLWTGKTQFTLYTGNSGGGYYSTGVLRWIAIGY